MFVGFKFFTIMVYYYHFIDRDGDQTHVSMAWKSDLIVMSICLIVGYNYTAKELAQMYAVKYPDSRTVAATDDDCDDFELVDKLFPGLSYEIVDYEDTESGSSECVVGYTQVCTIVLS